MAVLSKNILKSVPDIEKLTYRGRLLRIIVEVIIELKRFPSQGDLELLSFNRVSFPEFNSFQTLGERQDMLLAVRDFCEQFNLAEVIPYCYSDKINLPAHGVVYLYKAEDYYKIGRSNNVERRDKEIKLQLPFKVELIHTIETYDPPKIEKYWHSHFKSKRLNGEWFQLSNSDVRFFKSKTFM